MDTLTLTDDQRLRLALLDRCLPIAGGEAAVALAREAYCFVVGAAAPAAPVPQPEAGEPEPEPHPAGSQDAAIQTGHVTRRDILEVTGVPAGSWSRRIRMMLDAGHVVEDRSTIPYTYQLAKADALAPAEPEPEPQPEPPIELPPPAVTVKPTEAPAPPAEGAQGMAAVIAYLEAEGHEVLPQLQGGFLVDGKPVAAIGVVGMANRLRRTRHEKIIEVSPAELREYV